MDDEVTYIVKTVRRKLEVTFALEPEGFQSLVEGGIRFRFRTLDRLGIPKNRLYLNLYDDARKGRSKLESGIRGFFKRKRAKRMLTNRGLKSG